MNDFKGIYFTLLKHTLCLVYVMKELKLSWLTVEKQWSKLKRVSFWLHNSINLKSARLLSLIFLFLHLNEEYPSKRGFDSTLITNSYSAIPGFIRSISFLHHCIQFLILTYYFCPCDSIFNYLIYPKKLITKTKFFQASQWLLHSFRKP